MRERLDFAEWFKSVNDLTKKQYKQTADNFRKEFAQLYERGLEPSVAVKEVFFERIRR